jgi:fructose-specific phosphotransferase system IIC component
MKPVMQTTPNQAGIKTLKNKTRIIIAALMAALCFVTLAGPVASVAALTAVLVAYQGRRSTEVTHELVRQPRTALAQVGEFQ